jgi:hypothetical protein
LGLKGGFFFVLSEKMVPFLENFGKILKMSGQKKLFFCQTRAAGYFICTSIELQHFFFATIFFFLGKLGKICFGPPEAPGYPQSPRVPCHKTFAIWGGQPLVPKKIQRCFSQVKSREPDDYFYFDSNGPTVLGRIFGPSVGVFSKPLRKNGSKFAKFSKNPKNVGQKKINFLSNPCR